MKQKTRDLVSAFKVKLQNNFFKKPYALFFCWITIFSFGVLGSTLFNHSYDWRSLRGSEWVICILLPTLCCLISPEGFNRAVQYCLGLYVLYIYFKSIGIKANGEHPDSRIIFSVLLLLIYLIVEAMEIALEQLTARAVDSLPEHDREFILDVQENGDLFYEAREWLVIALVIGLTLCSHLNTLYLGFGISIANEYASFAFELLFTTVIVIWLAQSPGKRDARERPVLWMELCKGLWPFLKVAGTAMEQAGLFAPGQQIGRWLKRILSIAGDGLLLMPSQEDFYFTCLKRYGYALQHLKDEIVIHESGSAVHTQTGLLYIVAGERKQFIRRFYYDQGIEKTSEGNLDVKLDFTCWNVDDFSERIDLNLSKELQKLFTEGSSRYFEETKPFGMTMNAVPSKDSDGEESTKRFEVIFQAHTALPEELREEEARNKLNGEKLTCNAITRETGTEPPANTGKAVENKKDATMAKEKKTALAILYKIVLKPVAKSYACIASQRDDHFKHADFPCHSCLTVLTLAPELHHLQFGEVIPEALISHVPDPREAKRMVDYKYYPSRSLTLEVPYPMPGVQYKWRWELALAPSGDGCAPARSTAT